MTYTQVSTARKFAIAAFSGVVALSLMLPTQLAYADYYFGEQTEETTMYEGDKDASGEGWTYTAEGQQMDLVNYVGEAIHAVDQDLNITLEGDNTVNGGIDVDNGNLTITGDENKYGEDKPSLTIDASTKDKERVAQSENEDAQTGASITASNYYWDQEAQKSVIGDDKGSITIKDANITFASNNGGINSSGGDVTIVNSRLARGDNNFALNISSNPGASNTTTEEAEGTNILLKGSEIEATSVYASGALTIDNTNLTVVPPKTWDKYKDEIAKYYKDRYNYNYTWIEHAVTAVKGITLIGEENGEVVEATDYDGKAYYYLTTGSDDKIELKASERPAYWGPKGMPKTGDSTLPLGVSLSIVALFAAGLSVYSVRQSKVAGKHVK